MGADGGWQAPPTARSGSGKWATRGERWCPSPHAAWYVLKRTRRVNGAQLTLFSTLCPCSARIHQRTGVLCKRQAADRRRGPGAPVRSVGAPPCRAQRCACGLASDQPRKGVAERVASVQACASVRAGAGSGCTTSSAARLHQGRQARRDEEPWWQRRQTADRPRATSPRGCTAALDCSTNNFCTGNEERGRWKRITLAWSARQRRAWACPGTVVRGTVVQAWVVHRATANGRREGRVPFAARKVRTRTGHARREARDGCSPWGCSAFARQARRASPAGWTLCRAQSPRWPYATASARCARCGRPAWVPASVRAQARLHGRVGDGWVRDGGKVGGSETGGRLRWLGKSG